MCTDPRADFHANTKRASVAVTTVNCCAAVAVERLKIPKLHQLIDDNVRSQ